MSDRVWIINKADNKFETCITSMKKWVTFYPGRPLQVPRSVGIDLVKRYVTMNFCDNPEKYFTDRLLKQLVIRDAGIGDLLLLEPILRQLKEEGNREITVCTMYPEVYENNPYIDRTVLLNKKEQLPLNMGDFESYEDLRNYSETCSSRDRKHRTECYNEKFNLKLKDKEPRVYFAKGEKPILKKKKGKTYIGLQLDASHGYRRYFRTVELIEHFLEKEKDTVMVLLGDKKYVNFAKNKRVLDYQGKTGIRDAFNIIRDLDYMLSVDSGLMHVALALHIPTVCIFSIIKPELRVSYYTGDKYILFKDQLQCIGCGSNHMVICKHGDIKKDPNFIPPCLDIEPYEVYQSYLQLKNGHCEKVIHENDGKVEIKSPNINLLSDKKLIMPIIVLNEEKNLPRFIELVMKHPSIGKVIAIDGGSNDKTVEILKKAGAFVYMHYYDVDYHDMQALQRNVSCSFVKDGEKIIIMDIDECFSKGLSDYLPLLAESETTYGVLSRRTFKYYDDITDPKKQVKDYPDYQPRFFTWDRKFKWVASPHHNIYNAPMPVRIQKDIIHFECEGKDRAELEARWSKMQAKTKEVYK